MNVEMIEKLSINEQLNYEKLSQEEMDKRGILGRLYGPVADTIHATRNGRKYGDDVWEAVFDNAIMKEKFERGGVFGECGHPADRSEVDMEKIALCMPKPPKKDKTGKLVAFFDILATPCGKILKTLCDYGYKIGISSRGNGDTYLDDNGNECVDANTYDCECFDAVLIPAVKAATLSMVEGLDTRKAGLRKALCEALNTATDEDKKIMKDKLDELKIDYSPEKEDNIEEVHEDIEADNAGSKDDELQEVLQENRNLEKSITTLQEKLSVCYAKERKLLETLMSYKKSIELLAEDKKKISPMETRISQLEESLNESKNEIKERDDQINSLNEKLEKSDARLHRERFMSKQSMQKKDNKIEELNESIKNLTSQLSTSQDNHNNEVKRLNESIEDMKKDSQINFSEYSKKLEKANALVEKYKSVAKTSVDKYISSQALRLGVTPNEIKNKLSENFSFAEIDSVCESLQDYQLNVTKLPFNISKQQRVKAKVTESYEPIKPANVFEDEVDSQLEYLAGLR